MNKFRKLGFITYNGKILVNNSLLNAVLHDKPAPRRDDDAYEYRRRPGNVRGCAFKGEDHGQLTSLEMGFFDPAQIRNRVRLDRNE
jgi:hypothetical protein